MVDIMNEQHKDLIPIIVREFCLTCSDDNAFTINLSYGKKKYKNVQSHRIFSLPRNKGKQE